MGGHGVDVPFPNKIKWAVPCLWGCSKSGVSEVKGSFVRRHGGLAPAISRGRSIRKEQQDKEAEVLTLKTKLHIYNHHKTKRSASFDGVSVSFLRLAFHLKLRGDKSVCSALDAVCVVSN